MSVNLEQIDMLKERANISYAEAKEILEKSNYDIVEALISLEKQEKVKYHKTAAADTESDIWKTTKKVIKAAENLVKKGNVTKFIIRKSEKTVVDLPVTVVVVVTVIALPVTVIGILAALVTNHKIRIVSPDGENAGINKTFDKLSNAVNTVSSQVAETINNNHKQ